MFARFLLLVVFIFFVFCPATTAQQRNISSNNITLGSSLSTSDYWSSNSGEFAFGFYPIGNGFAVGIWYAKIRQKTLVWTAKRDDPPLPPDTKLLLTSDGRLILQNQQAQELPVVDMPLLASSASLLDSGNLVLYNSNFSVIWQSFESPTDTLLPGQHLLAGQKLISSLSEADHSSGKFQLVMQIDGNLVQYPADGPNGPETAYWNSNTYGAGDNVSLNLNGTGRLYLLNSSWFNIKNLYEGNFSFTERTRLYRLTLDADGLLHLYSHDSEDEIGDWTIEWSPNMNKCDPKGLCGPNEYCSVKDDTAVCTCFLGFDKIHHEEGGRNFGCKRLSPKNCSDNVIQELGYIMWLDGSYSILENVGKDTCRDECSKDCNCEAAIYKNQQCHKQTLPLRFGRVNMPNDQGIALVKVGGGNSQTDTTSGAKKRHQMDHLVLILGLTFLLAAILVLVISGLLIYKFRVRGYKHISSQGNSNSNSDGMDDGIMLRSFKYTDLEEATNGFEEEVGKGAFGTVFKGVLSKGQSKTVIAVKRLEIEVAEGEREFQNEVKIIGRTHHRNLVQLLGYCHEGTNRLLVYEYMSNGSLADFLFKSSEGNKPKWEERIRIALDIARGILYLHEECKTQIIHCDIKPENILMDENERAKISDFGVAKLLMPYQTKTRTRMRGTRGYVAPEWHRNMPVTTKADVYSFGIMLLEIVCCRRSLDMDADEDEVVLSEWVYDCFEANEVEKVVVRGEVVEKGEVERVVKVGLWCIQNEPSLRPLMKKVVLMLEGTVEIPIPPSPASFLSSI